MGSPASMNALQVLYAARSYENFGRPENDGHIHRWAILSSTLFASGRLMKLNYVCPFCAAHK